MYYRYSMQTGLKKTKTKSDKFIKQLIIGLTSTATALIFTLAPATAISSNVIYNNIPNPVPGNLPSEAFEATGTSEFGGQVSFAGTNRQNPKLTILLSSWGCESGNWYLNDCATTPGSTFEVPITLNVYEVASGNQPGTKLLTTTKTFNVPYRPSADPTCTGADAGKWKSAGTCYNGFATPVVFDLTGMIPDQAIISVAYNTTHYGYAPIGESASCYTESGGCGYDSLNVALNTQDPSPSVGTVPTPDDAYLKTAYDSCSHGAISPFNIDTGCWTGYQPAIKVEAKSSKEQCKNNGWRSMQDSNGKVFKNQGDCVSFFATNGKNLANN